MQYRAPIQRHIRAMVRDADETDELTQETFARALAGAATVRDAQATLAWLYRIATNISLDHLRRRRATSARLDTREFEEEELGTSEEGSSSIGLAAEQTEMSECVQRALATLPDSYRVVLILHDAHGLSNPEIAEILGCSLATVKIRVHRARKELRKTFDAACVVDIDERGVVVCESERSDLLWPRPMNAKRIEKTG